MSWRCTCGAANPRDGKCACGNSKFQVWWCACGAGNARRSLCFNCKTLQPGAWICGCGNTNFPSTTKPCGYCHQPRPSTTRVGRPYKFSLAATSEQEAIGASWEHSFRVRVQAGAGTGKTSTMKRLADIAVCAGFSVVYMAYNKQVRKDVQDWYEKEAKDAWGILPDHDRQVLSTTMDAFALGRFRQSCSSSQSSDLPENLCKVTPNADLEDLLASTYGQFRSTKQAKAKTTRTFVNAVVFLLFKFLRSDKSVISHSDFEWIARKCDIGAKFLVAGAQLLWENAKSNPKKVWFGFDQLEKTFQLNLLARSNDQILLHEKTVVLLDEAQDCTACQMSWINMISANCKCYAVGDIHQAIYQFRGAKPECFVAFAKSPLPLTQSFRFGRNIAAVANAMIFIKTIADVSRTTPAGDFNIEGVSDCDGIVDISTREDRAPCQVLAFIARSNIKLIERLIKELAAPMESRRRISFQPALQKCMDQLVNLLKFKCGELRVFKDTTTGTMFDSYHELKAAVDEEIQKQDEDTQDDDEHCLRPISRETIRLVTLMEKCGPNTDKLLEACEARPDHTEAFPRLILRTVHGAKGDEWDFVEVADDFTVPVISKEGCRTVVQNAGEINFIYVAVTRAKKVLLLPRWRYV